MLPLPTPTSECGLHSELPNNILQPPPIQNSRPPQSEKPPFSSTPGSTVSGKKQTMRYGEDGFPEVDVDVGHDHGAGDPHSHDWGRPSDGGPPTHADRGRGRPFDPNIDPPTPKNTGSN